MIQLQSFVDLYSLLVQDFDSAAITTHENQLLHVKSNEPIDYDSLWFSINTCYKYFPLKTGDVVLLNDPYSGGTTLDQFTFVTTLLQPDHKNVGLRLAVRFHPKFHFNPQNHIEKEGLRIPPTPLVTNGVMNSMVLDALCAHPDMGKLFSSLEFKSWIEEVVGKLKQLSKHFMFISSCYSDYLNSENVNYFLEESKNWALKKIEEHPQGEVSVQMDLNSGEVIKTKLEILETHIQMDFGGTSNGQKVFLTDAMTFGPCFEVLSQHYGFNALKNSGSFSILKIRKPTGCSVNAKFPAPTHLGSSIGVAAIQTLTSMAISQIENKVVRSLQNFDELSVRFDFTNSKSLSFRLPNGVLATNTSDGASTLYKNHLMNNLRVQQIETQFPLKILSIQSRPINVDAKVKFKGGSGYHMRILATDDGHIFANHLNYKSNWKSPKNILLGESSKITVNNEEIHYSTMIPFKKGDHLDLFSANGGHWKN